MKIDFARLKDHLDYALKNESSILRLISILGAFSDLKFLFYNELNDLKNQFNTLKERIKAMADNPEELERAVKAKHQVRDNVARAIASDYTKSHDQMVKEIREAIRCGSSYAEQIIHEVTMGR